MNNLEQFKEYYKNNKEHIREQQKEYYQNNKEELKNIKLSYYYRNRERILGLFCHPENIQRGAS